MTEYNVHLKGGQTVRIDLVKANFAKIIAGMREHLASPGVIVLSPSGVDEDAQAMISMQDISAIVMIR